MKIFRTIAASLLLLSMPLVSLQAQDVVPEQEPVETEEAAPGPGVGDQFGYVFPVTGKWSVTLDEPQLTGRLEITDAENIGDTIGYLNIYRQGATGKEQLVCKTVLVGETGEYDHDQDLSIMIGNIRWNAVYWDFTLTYNPRNGEMAMKQAQVNLTRPIPDALKHFTDVVFTPAE